MVVELDGEIHSSPDQQKHDSTRDKYLAALGNKVIRFTNQEVLNETEKVLEKITSLLSLWERMGEGFIGNRKGGVVWHTQGSGKSISMVFYTAKLVLSLNNPTVVVITDRNDLDDQLFDTFAASKQLLRQEPVQAKDREHLKDLLNVASGGIVFTIIQKFMPTESAPSPQPSPNGRGSYEAGEGQRQIPLLSGRTNIVVIADEAHRTQYGFEAKIIDEKTKKQKR